MKGAKKIGATSVTPIIDDLQLANLVDYSIKLQKYDSERKKTKKTDVLL